MAGGRPSDEMLGCGAVIGCGAACVAPRGEVSGSWERVCGASNARSCSLAAIGVAAGGAACGDWLPGGNESVAGNEFGSRPSGTMLAPGSKATPGVTVSRCPLGGAGGAPWERVAYV